MERSLVAAKRKCIQCRPFLVLLLLLFLQLALFALTVIMSYAVESGVAHLHHVLFDLTPPLPLETSLMLYCVSLIAECITEVQHKNWTILSVKKHHIMLIVIPNIVYILFFSLAFINIFIEFQAFHTIDSWHFGVPESSGQTALYMLSISYIIFCLTRLIRKDLFQLFISLPHHQHSHSVVLLIGFLSQCIATTLYSIPLFVSGYIASVFEFHVATEFAVMNTIGLGMGLFGSWMETKAPWPKTRQLKPYFLYENLIYSRVVLLEVVLLPSFHYLFFEPGKLNFLFTKDRHVVYFTFCVAISLQHVVKILATAVMQHGSADLIFGWAWGSPELRSRNHKSQSGLDGGFLRDGDSNTDKDSDTNERPNPGTSSDNCWDSTINLDDQPQVSNNNPNPQETQLPRANNNFERGLPSFSFPRDLIQTPIETIVSYGFRWIRKLDFDPNLTEHNDDENSAENYYSCDNILQSESSFRPVSMHSNSISTVNPVENPEDTYLNNVVVPVIPNKGVDNINNNFRNQNSLLITASHSK